MMTAFEDFIADPTSQRVILCELRPRQRVTGWTLKGGTSYTWQAAWSYNWGPAETPYYRAIYQVILNGAALTEVGSVGEVESTADSWYYDSAAKLLYVYATADPDSDDKPCMVAFEVYLATEARSLNSRLYAPLLKAVPSSHIAAVDFVNGGQIASTSDELSCCNRGGDFDALAYEADFDGAFIRLLLGGGDLAYNDYQPIYTGWVDSTDIDDDKFSLRLRPLTAALGVSGPLNTFNETDFPAADYPDIGDDLRDKPVPVLLGQVTGIKPPRIGNKDGDWYLETNGNRFAYITDAAQRGLDVTGDLYLYADVFVPDVELDVLWALLSKWYETGNQRSYALVVDPQPTDYMTKGGVYLSLSGDGINSCMVEGYGLLRGQRNQVAAFYKAGAEKAVQIWINGEEITTQIVTGTLPAALFNSSAQFRAGAAQLYLGDMCKFPDGGKIYEAAVATKSFGGGPPSGIDGIVGWWKFEGGLQDSSSKGNHLRKSGFSGNNFLNEGGQNPVRHHIILNGTDEYGGVLQANFPNKLLSGFVIEAEIRPITLTNGTIFGRWRSVVEGESFILWYLSTGYLRLQLLSPANAACILESSIALTTTSKRRIKGVYNGATQQAGIWIEGVENWNIIQGSVPATIKDCDSDFLFGCFGYLSGASTNFFANAEISQIAISASPTGQFNGNEITDVIIRWRPEPEHIYVSGSDTKLADDLGDAHATLKNCGKDNISYQDGGDVYVIADPALQSVKSIDRIFYDDGGLERDLNPYIHYIWDAETNRITIIDVSIPFPVYVDVQGAVAGDFPGGISGLGATDLAGKASDAIRFLLQCVLELDSTLVDVDSFTAAHAEDNDIGLYLDSLTSLSSLGYQLCLSGDLLNLYGDDKFRLVRWAPSFVDAPELADEEIASWRQSTSTRELIYKVKVGWGLESAQAEAINHLVHKLYSLTTVTEYTTRLLTYAAAADLASSLADLAASPELTAEIEVPVLRLINVRPGDGILITRGRAAGPSGALSSAQHVVLEVGLSAQAGRMTIKAKKV